ncbi:GNAT family N-acetyltransferase [Algibacter mikhailovii]|uniref:GNAT family N-acetyltransferase n=1 Tax=Algibacter mikhailovii TaxID=425498 RepID=UPI0024946DA4|nr:GNAT family protein [Algibacter mikhailovii]
MQLNLGAYYISPIHPKDGWNLCNFACANEDRLRLYFPKTLEQNLNPELSNIFVEKKVQVFHKKEEFLFTIKGNDDYKVVGLIYIKELDWTKKQGEFAYAIDYNIEGQGLMTKSIALLSDYAFETLHLETLQIIVNKNNKGSLKVAQNNNFIWIKTLPKAFTPPGEGPLNMELYELYHKIES